MVFNQPLETATLFPTSWRIRVANSLYIATTAVALESQVTGTMAFNGLSIGPDKAQYQATPADLQSASGAPAPAFNNFPLG